MNDAFEMSRMDACTGLLKNVECVSEIDSLVCAELFSEVR